MFKLPGSSAEEGSEKKGLELPHFKVDELLNLLLVPWVKIEVYAILASLGFLAFAILIWLLTFIWPAGAVPKHDYSGPMQRVFLQNEKAYAAIGIQSFSKPEDGLFDLPDLRAELVYLGPNDRPDTFFPQQLLLIKSTNELLVLENNKSNQLWLLPTGAIRSNPPADKGTASPLSLQIEPRPQKQELLLQVHNQNAGAFGAQTMEFLLAQDKKSISRSDHIDEQGLRLDLSVLTRAGARWYGQDEFLKLYGGAEYETQSAMARLELNTADNESYTLYVKEGSILVWEGDRFVVDEAGPSTQGKPLMQLQQMDDRLMQFVLWDSSGRYRFPLSLVKLHERYLSPTTLPDFKLVGVRSKTQAILEIGNQRFLVQPFDWLFKEDKGWQKLVHLEDIEEFVSGKLRFELFVLDNLKKHEGGWIAEGHLFSPGRSEVQMLVLDDMGVKATPLTAPPPETSTTPKVRAPTPGAPREVEANPPQSSRNQSTTESPVGFKKHIPALLRGALKTR